MVGYEFRRLDKIGLSMHACIMSLEASAEKRHFDASFIASVYCISHMCVYFAFYSETMHSLVGKVKRNDI